MAPVGLVSFHVLEVVKILNLRTPFSIRMLFGSKSIDVPPSVAEVKIKNWRASATGSCAIKSAPAAELEGIGTVPQLEGAGIPGSTAPVPSRSGLIHAIPSSVSSYSRLSVSCKRLSAASFFSNTPKTETCRFLSVSKTLLQSLSAAASTFAWSIALRLPSCPIQRPPSVNQMSA